MPFVTKLREVTYQDVSSLESFMVTQSPARLKLFTRLEYERSPRLFMEEAENANIIKQHYHRSPVSDVYFYSVCGFMLGSDGLLFDTNGILYQDDCYPEYIKSQIILHGNLPDYWARSLMKDNKQIKEINAPCIVCMHPNLIYGHFLLEIMPRLYMASNLCAMHEDFVVPLSTTLPNWAKDISRLYIQESRIIWYDASIEIISAPKFILSPMLHSSYNFHPAINIMIDDLHQRLGIWENSGGLKTRKIYLSRSKLSNVGWHKIENEAAVEDAFHQSGFEIVHPQLLTFRDQLLTFKQVGFLAGVYGSAAHNSLFCGFGIKVGLINRINDYQDRVCDVRRQVLGFMRPTSGEFVDWRARHMGVTQFSVDYEALCKWLEEFIRYEGLA